MRVIFAGTPEFARVALERLQAAGFTIALVLTQPENWIQAAATWTAFALFLAALLSL